MRLIVDEQRCIGSGQCVLSAPEVFDQRDTDGISVLLAPEPPVEQQEAARRAVNQCPATAIRFTEE